VGIENRIRHNWEIIFAIVDGSGLMADYICMSLVIA
jgi:hypothetical protein